MSHSLPDIFFAVLSRLLKQSGDLHIPKKSLPFLVISIYPFFSFANKTNYTKIIIYICSIVGVGELAKELVANPL